MCSLSQYNKGGFDGFSLGISIYAKICNIESGSYPQPKEKGYESGLLKTDLRL